MDVDASSKENLSLKIYTELRMRLIIGDFAPDDTLSIRTLAEEFGVSAMPVREALKRLEFEKALSGSAKRAYRVPVVSSKDAANLFFVRATLEGAAAELAVGHLSETDLQTLSDFARRVEAAWEGNDARAFLRYNFEFHSLIYQNCGNPDLRELAEMLYARCGPWLGKAIRDLARSEDWVSDHHHIVDAMRDGDKARVRDLIEDDVNWGTALFRRM